jgi:ketosteroid isomerase-like protein
MKKSLLLTATILATLTLTSTAQAKPKGEKAIAAVEQRIVEGFKAKDAAAIMSNFAAGDSLVVFDVTIPRQFVGASAYKKDWEDFFAMVPGPIISCEMSDLSITASGKLGFSHCILHAAWNDKEGKKIEIAVRVTDGFQKIDGKWLIVHEHVSVPVDLNTGMADLASKP